MNRSGLLSTCSALLLTATAARAVGPSGAYSGAYTCGLETIQIQFTVNTLLPDGTLGATIVFQPASVGRQLAFRVKGQFTTSTNHFQVLPMRWETRPVPGGHPMFGLEGQYDSAAETLSGNTMARGCGPVTLKRDAQKTEAIEEQAAARREEIRNAPQSAASTGKPPEACLAFLRWVSRATEEYSETYKADTLDQLHLKLLNLYEDAYFVPFFGKPVDQMTRDDLATINANMEVCNNSPRFHAQFNSGLMGQFLLAFRPGAAPRAEVRAARGAGRGGRVGGDEVPDNRRNRDVAERRKVREMFHGIVDQLSTIPASGEAYPQAVALDKTGRKPFAVLWPSEFKTFETTSAAARRRSGEVLLVSRVSAAIAGARTRDTILRLDQVAAENHELFLAVGPEIGKREDSRLSAALHQGLVGLMADERKHVDGFGSGLSAVEGGARWHREFNAVYARVAADEVVKATLAHFAERRASDLSAAASQIAALIGKATNGADLQGVEGRYVLESDRPLPAAAPVFSALVEKRWQVARDVELLRFSDWEKKHMVPNTIRISVENEHIPPPTDREVGLAFLRSYAHNGGRITGPNTVTYAMGLGIAAAVIEIKNSKVDSCVEKESQYECTYRVWPHISVGQDLKDLLGRSIQADMLNAQYGYLNNLEPKPVSDRFHVEITGWVSPTLDRKIQANALSFWQDLAKDMAAASCAHRIATGDRTAFNDPACNR